jgi:hypothetical protein
MKTSLPATFSTHDEDLTYFLSLSNQEKWETIINIIDPDGFSVQHFYLEVLKAFNRNKIEYMVTGDIAIALHGYIHYQVPLDIWVETSPLNLEKLKSTLIFLGYDKMLMENMWIDRPLNQIEPIVFCDTESVFCINLITAKTLYQRSWQTCKDHSLLFQVNREVKIQLLAIDDLIFFKENSLLKETAGQDLMDAEELKMIKKIIIDNKNSSGFKTR